MFKIVWNDVKKSCQKSLQNHKQYYTPYAYISAIIVNASLINASIVILITPIMTLLGV